MPNGSPPGRRTEPIPSTPQWGRPNQPIGRPGKKSAGPRRPQSPTGPPPRGPTWPTPTVTIPTQPRITIEQVAASLNWLCARWLERRHRRRTGRDAPHRESFTRVYHQQRNLAATRSRLRRYAQTEGAL